jgi:hypothetical protein
VTVVDRFFGAFAKADPVAMHDCLHEQISYSDPLFPDLRGGRVGLRWHWLLRHATEVKLQYQVMFADDRKTQAKVELSYRWRGRAVALPILSTFALWDDLIVRHVDEYPYWLYARQVHGASGLVLGKFAWVQSVVQRRAAAEIDELASGAGTIDARS